MKQLTLKEISNWLGDEYSKEDVLNYLLSILNNDFSISDSRKEILEYNNTTDETIED